MEKVKNLSRTARAQKILPEGPNKSDHACAIPDEVMADPLRSVVARRSIRI